MLRSDRLWLVGLAAGLVANFVGGLFLFPIAELEPVVWLLAGLVLAASRALVDRPSPSRAFPVHRTVPVVLGVLAAVALVAGVLDVTADRRARRAADALAEGDADAAADAAASAAALRPDLVRLHLLEARARVADEQGALAGLAAVDDALSVSPADPIARRERARLLVARAEATRARLTSRRRAQRSSDCSTTTPSTPRCGHSPRSAPSWMATGRRPMLRSNGPRICRLGT